MRLSGSKRICLMTAFELAVEAEPARIAEGDLRRRVGERAHLLLLDQDRAEREVAPREVLRPLALDQCRCGRRPAPRPPGRAWLRTSRSRSWRLVEGGDGEILRLQPLPLQALLQRLLVEVDGAADLVGREDLRAGLVGLLDLAERLDQRLVGGRDVGDRDEELGARTDVGDRLDAGGAEDVGPEVGVAQIFLGDLADRLVGIEGDVQVLVVSGSGARLERKDQRRKNGEPPSCRRTTLRPNLPHAFP